MDTRNLMQPEGYKYRYEIPSHYEGEQRIPWSEEPEARNQKSTYRVEPHKTPGLIGVEWGWPEKEK